MKSTKFGSTLLSLFKSSGPRTNGLRVMTRCKECGVRHEAVVSGGGVSDIGTMLHQPWCSVDVRNIERTIGGVRRC